MKILGIESSCDETAAAVVEDGFRLLSNVVYSQVDIHAVYGGVVPEVAARSHIEMIIPVIEKALTEAKCTWGDIDGIGVTYAPGLIGSLLVGSLAARTIAHVKNIPYYPVHHVEGHVYANFLTEDTGGTLAMPSKQPQFPLLALIVSGGHSQLVLFKKHGVYEMLGQTQDDAVGEAFDKVAKIIGLPYPGGPSISAAAEKGDAFRFDLPKAKLRGDYDFSFSGLKTAVLRTVQKELGKPFDFPSHELPSMVSEQLRNDIAACFQRTAVETLVEKTMKAFYAHSPASVVIAGGVAANSELRGQLKEALPISIEYAPMSLCTDNAAMIAALASFHALHGSPSDPLDSEVTPSISMNKTAWA